MTILRIALRDLRRYISMTEQKQTLNKRLKKRIDYLISFSLAFRLRMFYSFIGDCGQFRLFNGLFEVFSKV